MKSERANQLDRRGLIRKAAAVGAVAWTAPVILQSSTVSAAPGGFFTPKCAPGNVTATRSFVRDQCLAFSTVLTITINFAGPCPCEGPVTATTWCARKNSPAPAVQGATSTLSFQVAVPIGATITISGRVGLGCTDRDGDTQFALYNWSMTAEDNGAPCNQVTNVVSTVSLTGRTVVNSASCPALTATTAAPAIAQSQQATGPRPAG